MRTVWLVSDVVTDQVMGIGFTGHMDKDYV
jgi:hypothetical protein